MNLLAVTVLLSGFAAAEADGMTNLDFAARTLSGWEGEGFTLQVANADTGKVLCSVSSKDEASGGHTAYLHRAFILPANAGFIRCKASAVWGKNCQPNENLEVLLLAAGKRVLSKQVRTASGWKESGLLPAEDGQPREYIWPVARYAGQWLRLVLLDDDVRPGCYVHCAGFQVQTQEEFEASEFG
ncbi:MAG TPA: hypothetical protein VGY58_14430, partial [Gemmataceae bacterium]|nr:hypothetical protein [Gemmataceae bacterium]